MVLDRDCWQTPEKLILSLAIQYSFTYDCCASEQNKKAPEFSIDFESELPSKDKVCWMNPPFSKAYPMFKHFFKVVSKGVALYRCDNMETKVWQEIILKKASWVFIPKGRIKYEGFEGNGSRFPSALIGYNVPSPRGLKGVLLYPYKL